MAGIVLDVFALLASSALGIIGILFPDANVGTNYLSSGNSIVRIGIGLNSSVTEDLGGTIPSIKAYNEELMPIGRAGSYAANYVEAGKYVVVPVMQNMTFQQPTYLEVAGGPNAVCIAYLAQTWSDGTQLGWLGDMGKFCGAKWYYSNLYVSTNNGSMHKPFCTWIGGNQTQNPLFTYTGFRIHTPDFGPVGSTSDFAVPSDPTALCNYPKIEWYKRPRFQSPAPSLRPFPFLKLLNALSVLSFVKSVASAPINQFPSWTRSEVQQTTFRSKIIGSHDARHSSRELCASETSWGPDFISFEEGVFCDMTRKETWLLCSGEVVRDCYDWDSHAVVDRRMRKREIKYRQVEEWR